MKWWLKALIYTGIWLALIVAVVVALATWYFPYQPPTNMTDQEMSELLGKVSGVLVAVGTVIIWYKAAMKRTDQ